MHKGLFVFGLIILCIGASPYLRSYIGLSLTQSSQIVTATGFQLMYQQGTEQNTYVATHAKDGLYHIISATYVTSPYGNAWFILGFYDFDTSSINWTNAVSITFHYWLYLQAPTFNSGTDACFIGSDQDHVIHISPSNTLKEYTITVDKTVFGAPSSLPTVIDYAAITGQGILYIDYIYAEILFQDENPSPYSVFVSDNASILIDLKVDGSVYGQIPIGSSIQVQFPGGGTHTLNVYPYATFNEQNYECLQNTFTVSETDDGKTFTFSFTLIQQPPQNQTASWEQIVAYLYSKAVYFITTYSLQIMGFGVFLMFVSLFLGRKHQYHYEPQYS